jgi:hypothetical protein
MIFYRVFCPPLFDSIAIYEADQSKRFPVMHNDVVHYSIACFNGHGWFNTG